MEELYQSKCKNCGAGLVETDAVNGVIKCRYCHSAFTLPKEGANPAALSFLRQGDHDLDTGKFDDAYTAYNKAAQLDPGEPEAYFGMALAEFKVQYLKDTANNCLQPICHEISDKVFAESKNYKRALELATSSQRIEYERKGIDIDTIGEEFYKQHQAGIDYDCFICVKVTDDETKGRTADYKYADDIYFELKGKGYKPFFSERELRGVAGSDYEARILYALYSSECMLVVCSKEEYLRTPWVKNEYTRFLKLVNDEEKESDSITIVFNGKPIEKLPGKNGKIQGIDFGSFKAIEEITSFVEKHSPEGKARLEKEKARQRELEEERERKLQEIQEAQLRVQREFEEKLKNVASVGGGGASETVQSLLTCAEQELAAGEFNNASDYFKQVRNRDPMNDSAWWGFFLVEFGAKHENELLQVMDCDLEKKIEASRNFKSANQYLSDKNKERVNKFIAKMRAPALWWGNFLKEMGVSDEMQLCGKNISSKIINKVKSSENYKNADKYADAEYRARIDRFNEVLESPESNWVLFLQDNNVRNENEVLDRISADRLAKIESNACFNNAKQRATGELKIRIDAFCDTLHSPELWWGLFLQEFRVAHESELLRNFGTDLKGKLGGSNNYCNAKRFANGNAEYTDRIAQFETQIDVQEEAYKEGRQLWYKLTSDYDRRKKRGDEPETVNGKKSKNEGMITGEFLDTDPDYKKALGLAEASHVLSFIKQIEDKGRTQRSNEQRRVNEFNGKIKTSQKCRAKIIACNVAVGILCLLFVALEALPVLVDFTSLFGLTGNGFVAKLFTACKLSNMSLGIKLAVAVVLANGILIQLDLAIHQLKAYSNNKTSYSGTGVRVSALVMQIFFYAVVIAAQYIFFNLKPVSFGQSLGIAEYGTIIVVALAMSTMWLLWNNYELWHVILALIIVAAYHCVFAVVYIFFPLYELSAWMELIPLLFAGIPLFINLAVARTDPVLTSIILFIVSLVLLASVGFVIWNLTARVANITESTLPYTGIITVDDYFASAWMMVGYIIGGIVGLGVIITVVSVIVRKARRW